ncbi:MAG TPA: hypothetical protein VFN53_13335 [Acidobacteriaceae bacterium]|nr:hypothetical protein [Acidobacteriaceae bacterium]
MRPNFAGVMLAAFITVPQLAACGASAQSTTNAPGTSSQTHPGVPSGLPPAPRGKSTVLGGAIREVDPVRDELTLHVFGGHPVKILFDARTQFYRNGKKTPLRDLGPESHASIQTVLDGTQIYALSIHALSQSPEGECEGQILSYDSAKGELQVATAISREPVRLHVAQGTPVVLTGQAAVNGVSAPAGLSSLVPGSLVSVQFASSGDGEGLANHISILAAPGSAAVFSGNITFLDLHANLLAITDPRDDKRYSISFDPARFPITKKLHQGTPVRVKASFDGSHYVADTIDVTSSPQPKRAD